MANQLKVKMLLSLFAFILIGIIGVSCSENEEDKSIDVETIQNYVAQSIFSLQTEGNIGKMGCFEFIFPISIEFPDGATAELQDYDAVRKQLIEWITANPDLFEDTDDGGKDDNHHFDKDDHNEKDGDRGYEKDDEEGKEHGKFRHGYFGEVDWDLLPRLIFPLEVVAEDGTISIIENRKELWDLRKSCGKNFYGDKGRHRHDKGDRCFSLVFPITLILADGSTITGENRKDLKKQLRAWKRTAEKDEEKPKIQFPVTIELEDGTTQEISDKDALQEAKENCSN